MAPLDLTESLADLADDFPTGTNLELDGDFGALERAAQGAPEKQYGDTVIPAVEPDWKDVAAQARALLDRTHDLRVLTHLAVAQLHVSGLAAFVAVLSMIRHLLETRWEQVHPQLDPEDDYDPTLRGNALLQLTEPIRVLRVLRNMPLAASLRDGVVSWRIISVANGAIDAEEGQEKKTDAVIRAAFIDTGHAALSVLRETAAAGAREAAGISTAFDTHAGSTAGPDLTPLIKLLREIDRFIGIYAVPDSDPGPGETPADGDAPGSGQAGNDLSDTDPEGGGLAGHAADGGDRIAAAPALRRAAPVTAASITAVTSRADALRLLDLVCRYYEQNEPSSPLPLMINRARKLADKGFLEILQDLAPDGLGQAQAVVQSREV